MHTRSLHFVAAAVAAATAGAAALGGSLTPPAGPVAPTFKSLTEVEPRIAVSAVNTPGDADSAFRISDPGSYYLTGNLVGQAGKHGIEIAAVGVTLDLNGFDVMGVPGSLDGIRTAFPNLRDIAVLNGSVRNFGDDGIDLTTMLARACRVERVVAMDNSFSGIDVGEASVVTECTMQGNGEGLRAGTASIVTRCTAFQNDAVGIVLADDCVVSECTSDSNLSRGYVIGEGSLMQSSSANNNWFEGAIAGYGSSVRACRLFDNGSDGIIAGGAVLDTAAQGNGMSGLTTTTGAMVAGCSSRSNDRDGIVIFTDGYILDNTVANNGLGIALGAGIRANADSTRIEGNHCVSNEIGVDVNMSGNFIVRNSCTGNATNWEFVAFSVFGEVSDRTAAGAGAAAVSGDSAPNILGSLGANSFFANFTH